MKRPALSLLAVVVSTACGTGVDPQVPGPADTQQLEALNQELAITSIRAALSRASYFAPLCDQNGYPLVGNLATKGGTTASEFCTAQRGGK